jgi:hypothetical protein
VGGGGELGQAMLELADFGPHDELAVVDHSADRRIELWLEPCSLRREIKEPN